MANEKLTVTLEGKAASKLAALAAESGHSPAVYAALMIEDYFEREMAEIGALKAAVKSADAGNLVPHEEVVARGRAIIEASKRKKAS
ncbi:hypothetical protein [Aurantimonas marina]|uniref:hypothetical protein n=1 Tax=Aurantimonas marina TaxID=2780508 RepID=UPI0019D1AD52|nr:hypothetical protein [Aurantimonas marina]